MVEYKYCPKCATLLRSKYIEGRKRPICGKCGWIHYRNPAPVAVCLVVNRKNELLLIKRGIPPCKGHWALPGGFIELHESLQEAGARELLEETGLEGKAIDIVGVHIQKSKIYGTVLVTGIELTVKNENITTGDDAAAAGFLSKDRLPQVPFESHRKLVKEFYASRKS